MGVDTKMMETWKGKPLALALALAFAVAIVGVLAAKEVLTPRVFAFCCICLMAVAAVAWFILLARAKKGNGIEGTTVLPRVQPRKAKIFVLIGITALLCVSLWVTRGGPWLPQLIGACFVIALVIGNLLRKAQ